MKKTLSIVCFALLLGTVNAQESLISEVMNVDAVSAAQNDDVLKADEEYTALLEKEKAKLDKDLEKMGQSYVKDVEGEMKPFTKVLEGAVEKEVNNQKGIVQTAVNTLTINLKKDKKVLVNQFAAMLTTEIRDLPKPLRKDKEKELADMKKEYIDNISKEFVSNQKSIKDFMAKKHVTDMEN